MSTVNHIEVRDRFLKFFDRKFREYAKSKGEDPATLPQMILPAYSLVPDDPSTLFTTSGMHQFKDDFTGNLKHGTKRATTCQKCMRTPDLENVGKTARHHTMFEMLGFFSFGDYFKKEAIAWIWEFYTVEMKLSKDKLRISVYQDDDEAYELWKKLEPSLHEKRWIYRFGENDNFWPAGSPSQGPNGVCGPCSEIFYDLGPAHDKPALKGTDDPSNNGDRFMEIGNIVFTQFERSGPIPGKGTLAPLPAKNIDFGGGMERLIVALEGVPTTLDTSLFMPVREKMRTLIIEGWNERVQDEPKPYLLLALSSEERKNPTTGGRHTHDFGFGFQGILSGWTRVSKGLPEYSRKFHALESHLSESQHEEFRKYAQDAGVREKRITDHIRASTFLIADGVVPSNEKQGYVLRRVLRRAYRDGNKLGFKGPFLHKLVGTIVDLYGNVPDYKNLKQNPAAIEGAIKQEEEAFDKVLARGLERLAHYIKGYQQLGEKVLSGAQAFDLHSTYGLPVDVTRDELSEVGMILDEPGFEAEFIKFREESRKAGGFSGEVFDKGWFAQLKAKAKPTEFLGYNSARAAGNVVGISHNENLVDYIREGSTATIVLDKTPFYGESGGQVGDSGVLQLPGGKFIVADTKKKEDYILHVGKLESGKLSTGDTVEAIVDDARRTQIRANHSATHLMHAALRKVLGEHVVQRGSEVAPDRLRFDFTHTKPVSWDERREIERIVNEQIVHNADVSTDIMSPDKAREAGAMALFGEKYGDKVRVLSMGAYAKDRPFSRELCGGTHVRRTGDIGLFKIVSEGSSAAGVRRIEAVTGMRAVQAVQTESDVIAQLGALLKSPPDKVLARVEALQKENRELKSAGPKSSGMDAGALEKLRAGAQTVGGAKVIVAELPVGDPAELLTIMESLRQDAPPHAVLLGGKGEDKAMLVVGFSPELVKRGLHAGKLVGEIAKLVGGGGGGKPEHAQAGGKNPQGLPEALKLGQERILAALK